MGHYPGSSDKFEGEATIYGPLPTHGRTAVALVMHTTETRGMPSFNNGDTAPHYVYDPTTGDWYTWAEYEDGYVGTMKGHTTGGHSNCKAFQVEILAYSDKAAADSVGGLWVGHFTERMYDDLAAFVAWARDRYRIGRAVTPTPDGGWLYGTSSPYRMTEGEWAAFSGLTAHGAVPLNTHWDTGVLDLVQISKGGDEHMRQVSNREIWVEPSTWTTIVELEAMDSGRSTFWQAYLRVASGEAMQITTRFARGDGSHEGTEDRSTTPGKEYITRPYMMEANAAEPIGIQFWHDDPDGLEVEYVSLTQYQV